MTAPTLILGDDTNITANLVTSAGAAVDVSAATEIKASLVSFDRATSLAGPYTCLPGASGASWSTGVIIIPVLGTDTTALTAKRCALEVQAIISSVKTTYLGSEDIQLVKGLIP